MQPKVKTNIEARVKDTGDIMTGNLTIKKGANPSLYLFNTTSTGEAVF
jgi:hypothetical protein